MAHMKTKSSTVTENTIAKGVGAATAAVAAATLSPIGVIPFILGGISAIGSKALLKSISVGEEALAIEDLVNEIAVGGNKDVQKKVSFFQEVWGSVRVIANIRPETIADTFDVTRPGVLNWETAATDPKTGKQTFKAKINAFQYHALQELLIAESKLHPENTQLTIILKILITLSLSSNAYTDKELAEIRNLIIELAEYKKIVNEHPNISLKLDDSVMQKLSGYVKQK